MKCHWCLLILAIFIIGDVDSYPVYGIAVPIQCFMPYPNPLPIPVRKACDTLIAVHDIGGAIEEYINEKVPELREDFRYGKTSKRQDVDHVFLRFGKKR